MCWFTSLWIRSIRSKSILTASNWSISHNFLIYFTSEFWKRVQTLCCLHPLIALFLLELFWIIIKGQRRRSCCLLTGRRRWGLNPLTGLKTQRSKQAGVLFKTLKESPTVPVSSPCRRHWDFRWSSTCSAVMVAPSQLLPALTLRVVEDAGAGVVLHLIPDVEGASLRSDKALILRVCRTFK